MTTSLALAPGTRIGRYEIQSLLGSGGMGEVYLALDTTLRRQVAIKLLPTDVTAHPHRLLRFQNEGYAVSSLNHPNILTLHEIGSHANLHFIATEYVEGDSLRKRIGNARAAGGLSIRDTLDIAIQIASALAAAHAAGIVHRDIKPDNIMIRQDGLVKVLDFGIAKLLGPEQASVATQAPTVPANETAPGVVMGTYRYMSPEQARGSDIDARSDIFSLGSVIYEMTTGRCAFEGETNGDLIASILMREPPSVTATNSDTPAELERIITKALQKDREKRYQVVKDLALDLKALRQRMDYESHSGTRTAAPIPPNKPELRRHKPAIAILLLALLILAVALLGTYYSTLRSAGIQSIAVLPFVNTDGDPNTEYLSDGISESLIDRLSLLPQLKVIARSSTFKYKGKDADPLDVGKALGVGAIMTGHVARRGGQLLVSAELVDTRDRTHLWGDHYARSSTDLQAMQEEIAGAIAGKLRLHLTTGQRQQLMKPATRNPEAYQRYLTGVFYQRRGGKENFRTALDYYNQAIALDPKFALAYAMSSNMYSALSIGSADTTGDLGQARAAVQKALELDPTLAEAHSSLGILERSAWHWAAAGREFKKAIALNPSYAQAYGSYAAYLSRMGRPDQALAEIGRAQELDPLSVALRAGEANILFWASRYEQATSHLNDVIGAQPDYALAYEYLGYTYAAEGMYPEAIAQYRKFIAMNKSSTASVQCYLGYALAMSGKRAEALAILQHLGDSGSPAELAILHAGLGDKQSALAALERAYAAHDPQLQYLKVEPSYDSLRADPRFQDLLRRVGLQ